MYYEYWGMRKAPFDNVPDPTLYWNQNGSLEDAVSEILFAIEEGNDCLAVIVGSIGIGKTLGLRVILNELDPKKYRVAFVTNPDLSTVQLMREITGQLRNKKITINYKDQLMEEFNTILFECANQGQKVVIFIDEANVMSTSKLHNLRLMTNLQDDQQNMVIFVLAGQPELGKRLESPALENLYQRIGVYCRIRGLSGAEEVYQYLSHRIQRCGGSPEIFTKEACAAMWEHSNKGVPRLINKIAKLCLKAGETNQIKQIDAEIVHAVASMFAREKATINARPVLEESPKEAAEPVAPPPAEPEQSVSDQDKIQDKIQDNIETVDGKVDPEMMDFIQGLPSHVRSRLQIMEDKQLRELAGKMAVQYIQQTQLKNSQDDPVILWDSVKSRIFSALKTLREPGQYAYRTH